MAATGTDLDGGSRICQRVLAVKIAIDWKNEADKATYKLLRDLSWQAARYRNWTMRGKIAESHGWVPAADAEKDKISKLLRAHKEDLSGDVYSCAEQEVQGVWKRDGKKIMAGMPPSEWDVTAALSITGKAKQGDSGIRLEHIDDQYVLSLRAVADKSAEKFGLGSGWIRLRIARNTKRDEWQGPILNQMLTWAIPIKKATVHIEPHDIIVRLTYPLTLPPLPKLGQRVATLGPIYMKDGALRLLLRTETQTKDYSLNLWQLCDKKNRWDFVRRRLLAQIGRRKGHARLKRKLLARISTADWQKSFIHTWTHKLVEWCKTQGVGIIRVESLETKDWPAHQFRQQLEYKARDASIVVEDCADMTEPGGERHAKALMRKQAKSVKRRHEAVRELQHQLGE